MTQFKYPEDRAPVAVAVALTALDLTMYFCVRSPWVLCGYWLLMVIPKGVLCAWNHHHQHVPTFRSTALNRLLELSYALHTGVTTHTWVLHHVLGHHQNFLDQAKDESRWKRADGQHMGVLEYTLDVALTAYPRAFQVGRRFPTHQRQFLIFGALTLLLVVSAIVYKPLAGIMLFALPMVCSMLYTAWVTYDHHSGLDTDDHFQASYNNLGPWFNRLTGNLGYHTAHHYRQGVHWSKLPEVHARIEQHIPVHLYRKSTFAGVLPEEEAL
ncbi:MAG TPA: fatty acid desaturase [Polyangiales bacterium]|nr:fatty acid desaturase [Polyangiales bacterium]